MTRRASTRLASIAVAILLLGSLAVRAEPGASILPNPSFELTEPPQPVAGVTPTQSDWLPRTWNVRADGGATVQCPDDPGAARSGRRCVYLKALQGAGRLGYGPMPVPDGKPWTVRLWARGHGQVVFTPLDCRPDRWDRLAAQTATLTEGWTEYAFTFTPPEGCRSWLFELVTQGGTEAWLDDAYASYQGLKAVGLPPERALVKDKDTLLYLDFEGPFDEDAYYVGGKVSFSKPGEGRFGRSLVLGGDGYVACSANENLDPAQGTIEVWCKLLTPGNDSVYHPIVSVPGPEGMSLHKDQYAHIWFGFSSGWGAISSAQASGYAWSWQPGAWRHLAACWDKALMQVFVDGKLVAWADRPKLSRCLGPELRIGGPDMELDDLRISGVVRYRQPVPPPR